MAKKILVVVDVQNDFVYGSLGSNEAVAVVPNIVSKSNWICAWIARGIY